VSEGDDNDSAAGQNALLQKKGSSVSCGCLVVESKVIVLRED